MRDMTIGLPEKAVGTLWGAALGDALGWPHEARANNAGGGVGLTLAPWSKRSGGRFLPYEERIEAGAYSDDTQLILAVARARLSGPRWPQNLASTEFPFWPAYERGGGGATLRAARLLQKKTLPWEAAPADRDKYLSAGGNGVAMRVAPHVLWGAEDRDFSTIAESVLADGVLTHGHPRALVGALVYAFALWRSLLTTETLRYGQILEEVAADVSAWARIPDIGAHWPSWKTSVGGGAAFLDAWDQTVGEVREALWTARSGLTTGALALDEETLDRLGCFNRRTNGAGTVCAVAAIFLAAKHAASPFEGVARAALAKGADTDTLASMAGALSGAVSGTAWMRGQYEKIQDGRYIMQMANSLISKRAEGRTKDDVVTANSLERFFAAIASQDEVSLPFGEEAKVFPHIGAFALADNVDLKVWRLETGHGQTLFVKRIQKRPNYKISEKAKIKTSEQPLNPKPSARAQFAGVTLWVKNLQQSRLLYCEAFGFPATRETANLIQLGEHLALRQRHPGDSIGGNLTIYVRVSDIGLCRDAVSKCKDITVTAITEKSGRKAFACQDFDGHIIEAFEE